MSERIDLEVHIARDEATGLWFVASSDIPGLRLEAASAGGLIERIEQAVPEMIELNEAEIVARYAGASSGEAFALAYRPVFDSAFFAHA